MEIKRTNRVWAMDRGYILLARGFVHLAAVIDWHSRRALAWRLSISMDTAFYTEAVEEAIAKYGKSEIFNTDWRQFTSSALAGVLQGHSTASRWMEVFCLQLVAAGFECIVTSTIPTTQGTLVDDVRRHPGLNPRLAVRADPLAAHRALDRGHIGRVAAIAIGVLGPRLNTISNCKVPARKSSGSSPSHLARSPG